MTLDELVVSLVLDAAGFAKGSKEIVSSVEKTKTEVVKHGTAIEGAITKASNSFENMARVALATLAVFAGAKTVEDFTRKITALDVAIGRLSGSMSQAPEDVSAIGAAVQRMGGNAATAMGGLRGLSDAFQTLRTTGSSAIMQPLAQLQALSGKAIKFGSDVKENFLSIADALHAEQAKNPAMASFLGRQILGSDDLTNLALKGRAGALADMAESRRHGVVRPEDVEAARKLTDAYEGLSQSIVNVGQRIVTALSPYVSDLLKQMNAWIDANKEWIATAIADYVKRFGDWIKDHQADIAAFVEKLGEIASVAGTIATAFGKQSPAMIALEALAVMFGTRLAGAINLALAALRAVAAIGGGSLLGGLAAVGGASFLANNTRDEQADNGFAMSTGERAMRLVDGGLADRVYGRRGEQQPHGPHHGVGVHAQSGEQKQDGLWSRAKRVVGRVFGGGGSPTYAGRGDIGKASAGTLANGDEALRFWMSKGLSAQAAAGLVGMEQGEALHNPNDKSGDGGNAHGAFQWHKARRDAIRAAIGIDIDHATHAQQLQAAYWEFTQSKDTQARQAWSEVSKPGVTPAQAAAIGTTLFERPLDKKGQSIVRGRYAEGWYKRHQEQQASTATAPVKVEVTDKSADSLGTHIARRTFGAYLGYAKQHVGDMPVAHRAWHGMGNHAGLNIGRQAWHAVHHAHTMTNHQDNSTETHIGKIEVHTSATDGRGIAADLGPHLQRGQVAAKANYGLA